MATKIIFDRVALDFPSGFKFGGPSETDFMADRTKPLQFIRICWLTGESAGMERMMIGLQHQMHQSESGWIPRRTDAIASLMPGVSIEEIAYISLPDKPSGVEGGVYQWYIHIMDWHGMELAITCSGSDFDGESKQWTEIIRSMRLMDAEALKAVAPEKKHDIRLRHLNRWGRKSESYKAKKTVPVEYAGDEPSPQEESLVRHVLEHEEKIANALAEAVFRHLQESFVNDVSEGDWQDMKPENSSAQGWAMARPLLNLYRSLTSGDMPKTVKDATEHCVLSSLHFPPPSGDGKQRLILHFLPDWDEEHGLYARLLEGRIETIGGAEVAQEQYCGEVVPDANGEKT